MKIATASCKPAWRTAQITSILRMDQISSPASMRTTSKPRRRRVLCSFGCFKFSRADGRGGSPVVGWHDRHKKHPRWHRPSPYAGVGENVIRAIAGYAGQPIRRKRDGAFCPGYPLTEQLRYTIAAPGHIPLHNRLFSLVDVPDLQALAALWPKRTRSGWKQLGP